MVFLSAGTKFLGPNVSYNSYFQYKNDVVITRIAQILSRGLSNTPSPCLSNTPSPVQPAKLVSHPD